jgi:DNA polymerase
MTNIRRIVRQHLESLQRAGVQQLGRPIGKAADDLSPAAPPPQPAEEPRHPPVSPSTADSPRSAEASIPFMSDITSPESLSLNQRQTELTRLCQSVAACTKCPELVANRSQTVFGVGDPQARLLFFGEAPGADEDRQGEPFVGRAGQLLTKIIEACTLTREEVYIMNVLKCRPPQNRNPSPEEAANCRPFFERQLEIIHPEYICCLGSIAATTLLETKQSIGKLRGRLHDWRWAKVLVTYHPAYLLRNPNAKREVWNDMQFLMREMGIELPS